MKKKKVIQLMKWLLIAIAAIALFLLARNFSKKQSGSKCKDVIIEIEQINGIEYIKSEEVKSFVLENNEPILNSTIESIDLDSIEKSLSHFPFVRSAEVYTDLDSRIHIEIEQMIPILRVHPDGKAPYYISKEGKTTPLSKMYTAHVIVANGHIPDSMNNKLYTLTRYVNDSKEWNAQIEQIFVTRDQDIILIPKLGKFSIILGDVDHLEDKFTKLKTFFKEGLNKTGWDKYKSVNLKFNKLVICK